MNYIPKKTSLVAQTVQLLREAIKAGEWENVLPGDHELALRMQINRNPLRAVFLVLLHAVG